MKPPVWAACPPKLYATESFLYFFLGFWYSGNESLRALIAQLAILNFVPVVQWTEQETPKL